MNRRFRDLPLSRRIGDSLLLGLTAALMAFFAVGVSGICPFTALGQLTLYAVSLGTLCGALLFLFAPDWWPVD